jgi:uncharacterized protein YjiS (DUF1127 family)
MTTLELYEIAEEKPLRRSIVNRLMTVVTAYATWKARRRTLMWLASLDAFQLSDVGVDPDDVRDALNGDARRLWDGIARRNARH